MKNKKTKGIIVSILFLGMLIAPNTSFVFGVSDDGFEEFRRALLESQLHNMETQVEGLREQVTQQEGGIPTLFPDLVITDLKMINFEEGPYSGYGPVPDQYITIAFTITNRGDTVAYPLEYSYTKTADGFFILHSDNTCESSLWPGESCKSVRKIKFPTSGDKDLEVTIDYNSKVVESNENNNVADLSLYILSSLSPTTIILPDGGEEWEIGQSYEIKWDCPDESKSEADVIDIFIKNKEGDVELIGNLVECSLQKYIWKIENILPGENSFKIQLRMPAGFQRVIDESNDYFSIIDGVNTNIKNIQTEQKISFIQKVLNWIKNIF
ncbi:MAG: CARDB domain-containing protein [Patescibacteria group bacterium]|nr:CARDB domain-containing protein [Patescibacteria group bacterium]